MAQKKKLAVEQLSIERVERLIYLVRGFRVMLDTDIATLYGVQVRALNQAVNRHPDRFPEDFCFVLTEQESDEMRSQILISNADHGGRRYLPRVFTEQGVAMLSGLLRSPTAVKINIEIMRAFVRIRRLLSTPGELVAQLQELAKTVKLHDNHIKSISTLLHKMLNDPAPEPKPKPMGFHTLYPNKRGK
jgi:hypothetical protein